MLVVRLPARGTTLRSRVNAKPKVHVVDSGLAARLLRLTPGKLAGFDPAALTDSGHLLETFVIGEVRKKPPGCPSPSPSGIGEPATEPRSTWSWSTTTAP